MSPVAKRLCAIAASAAFASCGRVGVEPLADDLIGREPDREIEPDEERNGATATDGDVASTDGADDVSDPAVPDAGDGAGEALDAGLPDAAPDQDAQADANLPACDGARALELCWYLGAMNTSCKRTCSGRGGYDPRMAAAVGTTSQDGSVANCVAVLGALGQTGPVMPGYRTDGQGLGCHVWNDDAWWLESRPELNPTARGKAARIACACLQ